MLFVSIIFSLERVFLRFLAVVDSSCCAISPNPIWVSTQLLQRLSGLVQKTMDTKKDTKETMDANSKNNRIGS